MSRRTARDLEIIDAVAAEVREIRYAVALAKERARQARRIESSSRRSLWLSYGATLMLGNSFLKENNSSRDVDVCV